jgi:hypothetical protein
MGFAVVHMMKIGKGGVRGIQSHNQREKESSKNPDIDKTRSNQNYDILNPNNINYNRAVKERIDNFATKTTTVRKDAVVMCNFVVTSDEKTMKAMSPKEQRAFFEDSTKFFMNRYGAENVVNATVHMDERTPHMHIGVVPITQERLSAKNLFTRKELTSLQTDFAREVGQPYGLERGKEGSEKTHLSEQRFKLETAKLETQSITEKSILLREDYEVSKKKYKVAKEEVELKAETLKNTSNDLSKLQEHTKGVIGRLDKVKAEKAKIPFVKGLIISEEDYSTLVNLAKAGEAKAFENLQLKSKVGTLEQQLEREKNTKSLEEHRKDLRIHQLEGVKDKYMELSEKHEKMDRNFNLLKKAVRNLGEETIEKVNTEIKAINRAEKAQTITKPKSRSFDMER